MAASLEHVLSQIQRWTSPRLAEHSDALLLERFVEHRDERAFAALLSRHGGMVLRSCRRVLGDVHAAEDAFQAVFLILARKAHTLRRPAELPGWLHGVARRVALKARAKSLCRPAEMPLPEELSNTSNDPLTRLTARELLTVLDEEVARLPRAQRSAVVLCCLEGHTQDKAAWMLDWTAGSLKGHLERGRRRLQARLRRRGIALSAALALVAVSRGQAASARLLQSTVEAALGGSMGSPAAVLAHSVLQTMFVSKLAGITSVALAIALTASAAIALAYRVPLAESPQDKTPAVPVVRKSAKTANAAPVDRFGDLLPAGAIARLGTVRFRHGGGLEDVLFLPDGRGLISAGDQSIALWDVRNGRRLRKIEWPGPRSRVAGIDLSPDGKLLALQFQIESKMRFWDVASGVEVHPFGDDAPDAGRAVFSPDGRTLALVGAMPGRSNVPGEFHLWEAATGKELKAFEGNLFPVRCAAFSSDGRMLAAGSDDGAVRLWEVATGRERQCFQDDVAADADAGGRKSPPDARGSASRAIST